MIRSVAWTAPVVAVAAAAPAFASSKKGRLSFNPSITFDGRDTKAYTASAVIDPGGVTVTTLVVRFTLAQGAVFTSVGTLPPDPDGIGPLAAPWTGIVSGGGTVITYTYNYPLPADAPDITQVFTPVRQSNSPRLLTIDLIINGTIADTVTYLNV